MNATETYILILNWNNGSDTADCVRSIYGYPNCRIFILDNNSTDDSIALMESGFRNAGIEHVTTADADIAFKGETKVNIILSQENLGFAGGNNLLMRAALKNAAPTYFWLLNNDTVCGPDTLGQMIQKMETDAKCGFVGSLLVDFHQRDTIQCCGVKYFPYFGVSKMLLKDEKLETDTITRAPISEIDFQHGASLLAKSEVVEKVGLMDEAFFLYSEEHDWEYRAAKQGYGNAIATKSIVYHKGSVSTSSKKYLFFYYYNRSSMIFARKHNPFMVRFCSIFLLSGVTLVRTKLNIKSLYWGFKGMLEGLFKILQ